MTTRTLAPLEESDALAATCTTGALLTVIAFTELTKTVDLDGFVSLLDGYAPLDAPDVPTGCTRLAGHGAAIFRRTIWGG